MKWLQALAAFLTLLLIVTRSRCLLTDFSQHKPCGVQPWRRTRRSLWGRRACAAESDIDDCAIKRDPAIILDDRHLADYQSDT